MFNERTWTEYRIETREKGKKYVIDWSTNDDNDDGWPDAEVTRDQYTFASLDRALNFTGKSRRGCGGAEVEVYLDGKKI